MSESPRYDSMLCADAGQTWWWPRPNGRVTSPNSAARRIVSYHHHHYGPASASEMREHIGRKKITVSKVWMEPCGESGYMSECDGTEPGAQPYWRADICTPSEERK